MNSDIIYSKIRNDFNKNFNTFLPGAPPDDININLNIPINFTELDDEKMLLIRSILPAHTKAIYLEPLDKGLSGASVYALHYESVNGCKSKRFVIKIGELIKIKRENEAIQKYVAPYIKSIQSPIYREGINLGLIAQEFVGLSEKENIKSLRLEARSSKNLDEIISNLFNDRLGNWYIKNASKEVCDFTLHDLFQWYLKKAPKFNPYPSKWEELQKSVQNTTGYKWENNCSVIKRVGEEKIKSKSSIIHGDLHSQNILIDQHGDVWPIDFYWCRENSSPVIDFCMLECSLKFLAIPKETNINNLIDFENQLCSKPDPSYIFPSLPYFEDVSNIYKGILEVRRFALEVYGIDFNDYLKSLLILTYSLSNHKALNLPYILVSIQILTGILS